MSKKNLALYMIGFVAGPISYKKYKNYNTKRHDKVVANIAMYTK